MRSETELTIPWEKVQAEIFTPEEIAEAEFQAELIVKLAKARDEKKITQKQLEEITGLKQSFIARVEKGKTNITLDTLFKIITPLGLKVKIEQE
ncbi:MAG TPA: helix-turn-helix transcriptional regulator [Paludibacter sp.]|jgi:DNA-binding XRE family transcriptional regulator|nr:helix-turn-helix transcriptional regulator [Paludibacter sp.]